MKYEQARFVVANGLSDDYRKNFDSIFGPKHKAGCNLAEVPLSAASCVCAMHVEVQSDEAEEEASDECEWGKGGAP